MYRAALQELTLFKSRTSAALLQVALPPKLVVRHVFAEVVSSTVVCPRRIVIAREQLTASLSNWAPAGAAGWGCHAGAGQCGLCRQAPSTSIPCMARQDGVGTLSLI